MMQMAGAEQVDPQSAPRSTSLRDKIARAALASGTAQGITRLMTVVLSVATARTLAPREVGALGLATIIVAIISMIGFYPEIASVAARGERRDEEYAVTAVAVRAVLVTLMTVAIVFTFPLFAQYLTAKEGGTDEIERLLDLLIWAPVLELLAGYPRSLLQRRLDLSFVAGVGLLQAITFVVLAVALLAGGQGYMGVACASLTGTGLATLCYWVRTWRKNELDRVGWPSAVAWRETITGTVQIFSGGIGGFLGERVDNLLVSSTLGPTSMSFYSMAWNGTRSVANVFGSAINFVLVPSLARIQKEPHRVRQAIHQSLQHSYLLLTPICAVMFVSAPELVSYVLGDKWLPLVPSLRVMSFTVLVIPALFVAGALLTGLGRAHLMGIAMVIHLVILFGSIPLLARKYGIIGAAYGDLLAMTTSTLAVCVTARVVTRQANWGLSSTVLPPLNAAVLAAAAAWFLGAEFGHSLAGLLGKISLTLIGYFLFLLVFGGRARVSNLAGLLRRAIYPRSSFEVGS